MQPKKTEERARSMAIMGLFQFAPLFGLVAFVSCCSPPQNWKTQSMMERIPNSEVLVYGRIKEVITEDTDRYYKNVEYKIDVFCVLRDNAKPRQTIGGTLSVFETDPPGQCVSNKHSMVENKKVILMLTRGRNDDGKWGFDNINVQGAVFEGNEANLNTIAETCQFTRMSVPSDAVNKQCPSRALRETCAYVASTAAYSYSCNLLLFVVVFMVAMKLN